MNEPNSGEMIQQGLVCPWCNQRPEAKEIWVMLPIVIFPIFPALVELPGQDNQPRQEVVTMGHLSCFYQTLRAGLVSQAMIQTNMVTAGTVFAQGMSTQEATQDMTRQPTV